LINSATNLSMKVVDDWQIARYRIGELYDPHLDSFDVSAYKLGFYNLSTLVYWFIMTI